MEIIISQARKKIYEIVFKFPGIHFREIQRKTNLAVGCLKYNLNILEESKLIVSEKCGKNLRYFLPTFTAEEKKLLGMLRLKSIRRILIYLLTRPSAKHRNIASELDLSPSTISWHLKRLESLGVIKPERNGRETAYMVLKKEEVIKVLSSFRESFLDGWVENFINMWEP